MAFDDDDDDDDKNQPRNFKGLKTDNSKSVINSIPKKVSQEEFLNKAKSVNEKLNKYGERATDLALKFKKILEDKTISQNKGILAQEAEREVLNSLVDLGIDMNVDEHEEDGMGSIGLIVLLFRSLMIQRDKINQLDYNLFMLNKQFKTLEKSIEIKLESIDSKK